MGKIILFFFFIIGSVAFSQENLSAEDFFTAQDSAENAVILDVRLHEEYLDERIPGALYAGEKEVLMNLISDYQEDTLFFVYCEYGKRSKTVLDILKKEGFLNLYHLKKGYRDWKRKGFPIDDSKID